MSKFDVNRFRDQFPILNQKVYGKQLIYLDNAATVQKPISVDKISHKYMMEINGNIHRGAHKMASDGTLAFENAREEVRSFLNASSTDEIIFTKGTTESINLVANSLGDLIIEKGDEIIVSELEHHSNIVPWQLLCEREGASIKVLPFNDKGELEIDKLPSLITNKTKLIAVNHVSNALGTVNPIAEIIEIAHSSDILVLIDGAQGVAHFKVDVQELDCDFYVFSGHKIYAPTGTGVLYGKREWLEQMPPFMGGGEMIKSVSFEKTTYNTLPYKFEPGTPNYTGVIALGEAIRFVNEWGIDNLAEQEQMLMREATARFKDLGGVRIFGEAKNKSGVISFEIDNIHSFDLGTLLDQLGIAVRTGRLCTDPIMDHFNISGVSRVSFAPYNSLEELDILFSALERIKGMF